MSSAGRGRGAGDAPRLRAEPVQGARLLAGPRPVPKGRSYKLKLATQEVECEIDSIERIIDSSTLETIARAEAFVGRNEVAELHLRTKRPVAFDVHAEIIADRGGS